MRVLRTGTQAHQYHTGTAGLLREQVHRIAYVGTHLLHSCLCLVAGTAVAQCGQVETQCRISAGVEPSCQLHMQPEGSDAVNHAGVEHDHTNTVRSRVPTWQAGNADQMLIQRLKKRKLGLKDRIVQLENLLIPDIIA